MITGKKDLNFELNLIPMIDILSVCISFLLMTVVWLQAGALTAAQAVGGQSQSESKNPPTVWAYLNPGGQIGLTLKNAPDASSRLKNIIVQGSADGQVKWAQFEATMKSYEKNNIDTGIIMPSKASSYADIIQVMDDFKKFGI